MVGKSRAPLVAALLVLLLGGTKAEEVLGCGGFLRSDAKIDFSKVVVKL